MLAKWGIIAGIALFVALMAATVIPAVFPDAAGLAAPILCANGRMSNESQEYHPEPGKTVITRTFFCTDSSGTHEIETLPTIGACMGIAFVPAFLVLAVTMGRSKLERLSDLTPSPQPEKLAGIGDASFKERLAELAAARNAGLITEEEFERKKKAMLDAL